MSFLWIGSCHCNLSETARAVNDLLTGLTIHRARVKHIDSAHLSKDNMQTWMVTGLIYTSYFLVIYFYLVLNGLPMYQIDLAYLCVVKLWIIWFYLWLSGVRGSVRGHQAPNFLVIYFYLGMVYWCTKYLCVASNFMELSPVFQIWLSN